MKLKAQKNDIETAPCVSRGYNDLTSLSLQKQLILSSFVTYISTHDVKIHYISSLNKFKNG